MFPEIDRVCRLSTTFAEQVAFRKIGPGGDVPEPQYGREKVIVGICPVNGIMLQTRGVNIFSSNEAWRHPELHRDVRLLIRCQFVGGTVQIQSALSQRFAGVCT